LASDPDFLDFGTSWISWIWDPLREFFFRRFSIYCYDFFSTSVLVWWCVLLLLCCRHCLVSGLTSTFHIDSKNTITSDLLSVTIVAQCCTVSWAKAFAAKVWVFIITSLLM